MKELLKSLSDQIKALALAEFVDCQKAAIEDGTEFLDQCTGDIALWTTQCGAGQLTKEELAYLIKGKAAVAKMHGLTQAGLTKVRLQKFRNGVIEIVVGGVCKVAGVA